MKIYFLESILHFGKYNEKSVKQILEIDSNYLAWCIENLDHFILFPDIIIDNGEKKVSFTENAIKQNVVKYDEFMNEGNSNFYDEEDDESDYKHPCSSEYYDDNLDWDQQSPDFWDDIT
jgi:hypothetical protein